MFKIMYQDRIYKVCDVAKEFVTCHSCEEFREYNVPANTYFLIWDGYFKWVNSHYCELVDVE